MMKAMTPEDIMQACPPGINSERSKKRIIDRFTDCGFVRKVSAEPDLYLPSPRMFLMATFREIPLNPDSEIGKQEVKRIDKQLSEFLNQEDFGNLEAFVEKCRFIYGWDDKFVLGRIPYALAILIERREAENERRMHGG